jgi:uncharacterized membrane protein YccC
VAFQSQGFFQPEPKPTVGERLRRLRGAIRAFVVPPRGVPWLEETGWQRGKREASELANRRAIQFMIVCAPLFAVTGTLVISGLAWPLRALLAAIIGLAVAIAAAFAIAGWYGLRAPRRQRDEARKYARDLENYARDLRQAIDRHQIADDFMHDTLEFARLVFGGGWPHSAADLDAHWRGNASATRSLLLDRGAAEEVAAAFDRQLATLDAKDDPYGDDEIRRVAASMQTTCQNVWSLVRREPLPTPPTPPPSTGS